LKDQEQKNIQRIKSCISEEIKRGCFQIERFREASTLRRRREGGETY
jgi:hypothetical protein